VYITKVVGTAFGPFRGESLDLAPGLNVVHGPNEAGKSSWYNAIYTGLAGRRKFKGKGFATETDYKNRHKPWSGAKWSVGLAVTLNDGRILAIEQDLAKGEWRIVDESTARAISDADLCTDSSFDGTRLLGLNRHSARATIFTGQADILRVLDDAGALQELLEKAASTGAADATADAALAWLKERRSEWVGVAYGKKPLATTRQALDTSRALAEERRDALGELLETLGSRRKLADALAEARAKVELSNRLLKWRAVYELRSRVEKAAELSAALAETTEADLCVDEAKLAAGTKLLAVFDGATDVVPLGEGPTAADLQIRLNELPQMPEGDLEPHPDIVKARNALDEAQTALATHLQSEPPGIAPTAPTTLSADELRTLADVLASTPPEVDTAAVAEFEQARDARSAQIAAHQREVDQYEAAYVQAKADYDAGVQNRADAPRLDALHNAERLAAEDLIAAARRQSDFLVEALSAQEAQAGVMAQEVALRRHREHVDAARERVLAEALEPEPEALKGVARAIDDADSTRKLLVMHAERAAEYRASRDDCARTLTRLLGQPAHAEITDELMAQIVKTFTEYEDACKTRAEVAQRAARRHDLIEAHTVRQELEANHQQALSAREGQSRDVVEFATSVGLSAESLKAAAEGLRQWVRAQASKRELLAARQTDNAVLTELLGGRELTDLQSDLSMQMTNAGDEPDMPMPRDLNAYGAEAKARLDKLIGLDGQLKGKIQALGNSLGSVAEAAEAEADALRAVTQVETLASCLDAATAELKNAKERANASIAPALADRMRPWLPRVTNGRYHDVTVDPENLTMQVTETTGQVRQADRLSLGTTEQIYILLRVSLSQVLSGNIETAPLIFDDVTTQSDTARTIAILELLQELSTEHQVILFTQEDEVVEWAQQHVSPDRDKIISLAAP
jgi:hypothetical protein